MRMITDKLPLRMVWAAILLPMTLLVGAAAVSAESMQLSTVAESGIAVEVDAWAGFDPANTAGRDVGLVPIVVTITNGSPFDRTWTIEPDRRFGRVATATPVARIAVSTGGTGKATLYVDPGSPTTWGNSLMKVSGFGLTGGEQQFQVQAYGHPTAGSGTGGPAKPILPTAISRFAGSKGEKGLENYTIPGGRFGIDLEKAPDDWRGWSVFSCILLGESEWLAMPAGVRKAFIDWIGLGGTAGLLVNDTSAERLDAIGLPAADPDGRRRVGAGQIVPLKLNDEEIDPAELERFLRGRAEHPKTDRLDAYLDSATGPGWESGFNKLFDVFGPRLLPAAAILGFLAVFGLVAGPLNVMLFAGPGRRARMFWTTPLISLAATAFLLALMFLRDGVGGAGARRVLGLLMPDQNGMAIIQEQFSRTGVLLGSSFPIREPSWMRPLGSVEAEAGLLEVDGRRREGDWFRSRSDQAYLLETVRPSRAKLELMGGADGPPAIISSIELPLDRVFVIDEKGKYWTAADIGTGERKPLVPSDATAYAEWFDRILADAGPIRRVALDAVRNRRGHAYAESSNAAKMAIQTLGSIRWTDDRAAFIGPFTRTDAK